VARRRVDVRREEILAAAAEQVLTRGFGHTRVADVASALGVSTSLIFYHFGTKERLMAEAFEYAVDRDLSALDATVARAKDPVDGVRRILALYSPQGNAYGWTVWVDAWAESLREPQMRETYVRLDDRWKDVLTEQIRRGVVAGHFECGDPAASAWRLSALLDGLAVQVMMHQRITKKTLTQWVRGAAAAELGIDPKLLAGRTAN
jgi:AcrR family transcriptional regulator